MAQWFRFTCPSCGKKLAATKEEAEYRLRPKGRAALYKYTCLSCRMPMLIKESSMRETAAPPVTDGNQASMATDADRKRLDRVALVANHFRSYQYGEPFEGVPVAMSHGFDITNADAEIILLGLDILRELQELDTSIDAAVNFRAREKRFKGIMRKVKEGIKP